MEKKTFTIGVSSSGSSDLFSDDEKHFLKCKHVINQFLIDFLNYIILECDK